MDDIQLYADFDDEKLDIEAQTPLLTVDDFSKSSLFSLNFYKQYFNVTPDEIKLHMKLAILPNDKRFLTDPSQTELYGAFWFCVTSTFISGAFGNIHNILQDNKNEYVYDISNNITALSVCLIYTFIGPYIYRFYTKKYDPPRLISLMSLLGYSMLYLVPISIMILLTPFFKTVTSLLGAVLYSLSLFRKVHGYYTVASYAKEARIFNIALCVASLLLVMFVEYILFR